MKDTFKRFDIQRSYYYDTHDDAGNVRENALTESEWIEMILQDWSDLEKLGCDEILIIIHDKDLEKDGNPKGLHAHAVVHFKNAVSVSSCIRKFGLSSERNALHTKNYSGSVQYLLHITQQAINDMKTIYLPEKIHGWGLDKDGNKIKLTVRQIQERMRRKTDKVKQEKEEVVNKLLVDVAEGRLLPVSVSNIYKTDEYNCGLNYREYLKEKSNFRAAEMEYLEQCYTFYQSNPHPSTLIYITGAGGLGKSTVATAIADAFADVRGVHSVSVPGRSTTFDFAGRYSGQKVSVFNEVPPEAFPVEQFLDIFDPLRASMVSSRNVDKPYFAQYAVFTASMSLETFLYQLWLPYAKTAKVPKYVRRNLEIAGAPEQDWHNAYINFGGPDIGNKIAQLRRRFAIVIDIKNNSTLEIRVFNKNINPSYSLLYTSQNFPQCVPFTLFSRLPFDINYDTDTVDMLLSKVVLQVKKAIKQYYISNGFRLPETYAQPFDSVSDSDSDSDSGSDSDFVRVL